MYNNKYNIPKFGIDRWLDKYPVFDRWVYILSEFNKVLANGDKKYWDSITEKKKFIKACKSYLKMEYNRRLRLYVKVTRGDFK